MYNQNFLSKDTQTPTVDATFSRLNLQHHALQQAMVPGPLVLAIC